MFKCRHAQNTTLEGKTWPQNISPLLSIITSNPAKEVKNTRVRRRLGIFAVAGRGSLARGGNPRFSLLREPTGYAPRQVKLVEAAIALL